MNHMFYFLLALTAVLAATAEPGDKVVDTDGEVLFLGTYYLLPISYSGGGLSVGAVGGKKCPLYITQENSEHDMGIPVRFSTWEDSYSYTRESENNIIEMQTNDLICREETYWWVAPLDGYSKKRFIVAGRKPDSGKGSSQGLFQIKHHKDFERGYRIVFCSNGNDCIDVGIIVDEHGVRRLALISTPFPFVFQNKKTSPKISLLSERN